MKSWLGLSLVLLVSGCATQKEREARLDKIIAVYRQQRDQTEGCYRTALVQDPAVRGQVTLAWTVDHTGKASQARVVRSSVMNRDLEDCVLKHLQTLNFPPQPRFHPAQVEFELEFRKQPAAQP